MEKIETGEDFYKKLTAIVNAMPLDKVIVAVTYLENLSNNNDYFISEKMRLELDNLPVMELSDEQIKSIEKSKESIEKGRYFVAHTSEEIENYIDSISC